MDWKYLLSSLWPAQACEESWLYLEDVPKIKVLHFAKRCLKLTAVILIMSLTHLASEQSDLN